MLDHGFNVVAQPPHNNNNNNNNNNDNDNDNNNNDDDGNASYDNGAQWLKAWNAAMGALWR